MGITPQAIELYNVYPGSIVFELGVPPDAVQHLRRHLQSNSANLRLLKVEKVRIHEESDKVEEWFIKEDKFEIMNIASRVSRNVPRDSKKGATWQKSFLDVSRKLLVIVLLTCFGAFILAREYILAFLSILPMIVWFIRLSIKYNSLLTPALIFIAVFLPKLVDIDEIDLDIEDIDIDINGLDIDIDTDDIGVDNNDKSI